MLSKELTYPITTNCVTRRGTNSPVATMTGEEIIKLEEPYELDNRLRIVSFETTKDMTTYINYLDLFSRISYHECTIPGRSTRFITMLDMGYIPVIAPPSFMATEIYNMLIPFIKASGVDYRELRPMRFDGSQFDSPSRDVWCSRIDMAKYLNCSLDRVNPLNFLKGVMTRANN